jgi:predicted phage gp36 major capsid-like protein
MSKADQPKPAETFYRGQYLSNEDSTRINQEQRRTFESIEERTATEQARAEAARQPKPDYMRPCVYADGVVKPVKPIKHKKAGF